MGKLPTNEKHSQSAYQNIPMFPSGDDSMQHLFSIATIPKTHIQIWGNISRVSENTEKKPKMSIKNEANYGLNMHCVF